MSDEIPVGRPPVPPGRHAAPGGWYPDPANPGQERYWDGWQWSRQIRESATPAHGSFGAQQGQAPAAGQPGNQNPGQQNPYQQGQQNPYQQNPQPGQPNQPQQANQYQQGQYQQAPSQQGQYLQQGGKALTTADGVPLAGWWHRVGSALLDLIIVTLVAMVFLLPMYIPMIDEFQAIINEAVEAAKRGEDPPSGEVVATPAQEMLVTAVTILVISVYNTLLLRFKGATVGKMITGLRVVPTDQGTAPPGIGWGSALIRTAWWAVPNILSCLLIASLVDVLFPAWQSKRQALHDMTAKTQVIRTR